MAILCSAFRCQKIIISVLLINMRSFRYRNSTATPYFFHFSCQTFFPRIILLQHNTLNTAVSIMPHNTWHPFSSIVIMKHGWIKTCAVKVNRLWPFSINIRRCHEIIMTIHKLVPVGSHIGIDQIKHFSIVRKAGSKDTSRGIISFHIQLRNLRQRPVDQLPVLKIFWMINAYPRKPFKSGRC